MKILIRADSSFLIGTGHITRCLTLSSLLRKLGKNVIFVSRILDGNIISLVEEKQFKVIKLPAPRESEVGTQYDKMRGVPLPTEINDMSSVINEEQPDWVIVDHYGLNAEWENSIRNRGIKLFSVDDLFREHSCDALLDQNYQISTNPYSGLIPSEAKYFIGPEYALLGQDFTNISPRKRNFNKIHNVLVFFGGTDPNGETVKFLKSVNNLTQFNFHVVLGKNNPFLNEIKKISSPHKNIELHIQINTMAELMDRCDLYFGSGGTITWERCGLGLPGICVSVAENQKKIAENLSTRKIHKYIGESKNLTGEDYRSTLLELSNDPEKLELYHTKSLNLKIGKKINEVLEVFN